MARLLIADDHPIFLEGLHQFLSSNEHAVICCARSAHDAIYMMQTERPDVLILDVTMEDGGGLAILRAVREAGNTVPVIFLTVGIEPEKTVEALRLGVNGIVLKGSDPVELLTCIECVMRGENHIDAKVTEKALLHSVISGGKTLGRGNTLTEREREIMKLIKTGLRNRDIALRCGLTEGTVKVHIHSIFQKLGVRSRAELIVSTMD
ncbi:response regulator transcription factor [Sphingomonas sp. LaA6.9]|uniref:response regulator n=1 Tax=Sphingomonas sp. LaA6.9 TaxID=2919914 RepID=UPI001F501306|nr:response regulator transcription factor [Sphingomonas sp. LaA6.9]MCJ8158055.1 response regulator transcription factor [Sphingomonas sp. LaA6.9]